VQKKKKLKSRKINLVSRDQRERETRLRSNLQNNLTSRPQGVLC